MLLYSQLQNHGVFIVHVTYSDEVGVDLVAELVGVTFRPKGRNVVLQNKYGLPKIVNDGETVLKEAAIEEGGVVGGGCCLLRLSIVVDAKNVLENDEQMGVVAWSMQILLPKRFSHPMLLLIRWNENRSQEEYVRNYGSPHWHQTNGSLARRTKAEYVGSILKLKEFYGSSVFRQTHDILVTRQMGLDSGATIKRDCSPICSHEVAYTSHDEQQG